MAWATTEGPRDAGDAGACSVAQQPIAGGDDRVEMRTGHRYERHDLHGQRPTLSRCCCPTTAIRSGPGQPLRGNLGADHDRDKQAVPDGLGEQPPLLGDRGRG